MLVAGVAALALSGCSAGKPSPPTPAWEADNPITPLPKAPLGIDVDLAKLPNAPTPERVRLGRWLFYDTRLSADNTISCATCHIPEYAFSQPARRASGRRRRSSTRR